MSTETISILGTGLAIVGLMWRMMASFRQELQGMRQEIQGIRLEVAELRRDVADLRERMARVEGRLDGYFARQAQEA